MPSMHVAAATYVAFAANTGPRWIAFLGAAYALLMTATLVYFGEHYVVDAVAGLALAGTTWVGAGRFLAGIGPAS